MLRSIALLVALSAAPLAHAEDDPLPSHVMAYDRLDLPGWAQTSISGEAAQVLFEHLSPDLERWVMRRDGSWFQVRDASVFSCGYSHKYRDRYTCIFFMHTDGTIVPAQDPDPEIGVTARIGVSN